MATLQRAYTITKEKAFVSVVHYSCIKGEIIATVALMGAVATIAQ
ncbi:MAG: hypothetical protein R2864_14700 [Syntrophotaleaceae bacterium]